MAGAKEIRNQIKSVRNTQKITRAMEMVAASKMRKAQERMAASKPYATHLRQVIGHLAHGHPEYHHIYMDQREIKAVGYIIVSTDRGLCGGLNINLFKSALLSLKAWQDKDIPTKMCLLGSKAESFFRNVGGEVLGSAGHFGDAPELADLIGAVKIMLDAYAAGEVDQIYLVNNQFVNTMIQAPAVEQILPLPQDSDESYQYYWDYIYEPDAKELLEALLTRYLEGQVYQSVIENLACEQAARMVAMKAASDNAGDIINNLQLVYNKARQAAITQELSEIISGAAAV